jgi:hypothetical protein
MYLFAPQVVSLCTTSNMDVQDISRCTQWFCRMVEDVPERVPEPFLAMLQDHCQAKLGKKDKAERCMNLVDGCG